MTELEKCELAKAKGYTYCPVSGEIKGMYGKVIRKKINGRIVCRLYVDKKQYTVLSYRLAWYLHYGKLPVNSIDHIDGNPSNNKIDNLRDVTHQQNMWNRKTANGCSWHKTANKFQAQIRINGRKKNLGLFHTQQEARNAYLKAKEIYHVINS
jgi:hypothetical protein